MYAYAMPFHCCTNQSSDEKFMVHLLSSFHWSITYCMADISIFTAMISNPWSSFNLKRNPRNRNAGKFMRLSDFLDFAKEKDLSGIMITVEVRI